MYIDFLKEILNYTKGQVNIKNYTVYFTGGGALLLDQYIRAIHLVKYMLMQFTVM